MGGTFDDRKDFRCDPWDGQWLDQQALVPCRNSPLGAGALVRLYGESAKEKYEVHRKNNGSERNRNGDKVQVEQGENAHDTKGTRAL
jgi:hypothetical protein